MSPKDRTAILVPLLLVLSLLALFVACLLGSTSLPMDHVAAALLGIGDPAAETIVWQIRLPRALAAWLVGLGLGTAGAAMQGLLRNPLAEPGVLGVSATASLFAVFAIYYGFAEYWAAIMPIAAIVGALAATTFLAIAGAQAAGVVTLVLIGVGLQSLASALMSLLMNLAPNPFSLADMVTWMMGSVTNRSFADIGLVLPFLATGFVMLLFTRRGLSALTLGEEAASGIGLDLTRIRLLVVLGAGLVAGGSVALAGSIGFVGIVAPHLMRPWVGGDPGRVLLPAGLLGGVFLVLADLAVRVIATDAELKLGVAASLFGAPIFIWIAARRRAGETGW